MKDKSKVVFVGLDVAKDTLAVSVADEGRDGEIRDSDLVPTNARYINAKSLVGGFFGIPKTLTKDIRAVCRPHSYGLTADLRFRGFFGLKGVSVWELQVSFWQRCRAVPKPMGVAVQVSLTPSLTTSYSIQGSLQALMVTTVVIAIDRSTFRLNATEP